MTIPPLVQTLPFAAWILLAALGFGSFVFVAVTQASSDATIGYVRFMAATAALLGFLALLALPQLGSGAALILHDDRPAGRLLNEAGQSWFVIVAMAYIVLVTRRRATLILGGAGVIAAVAALGGIAYSWAPTPADAVPLAVQLVVLSLATGGSMAAIVLGHWYLVTPKISERPLILQCRLLLATLVLQALLFVVWTTLGGGPGQTAFGAFSGPNLLLVVLRLLVTIAFPIALVWMAWRTAVTRSMESATGLLYINFAAILAGTIGAAALYVSSGILV
jgi:hypothetical protein